MAYAIAPCTFPAPGVNKHQITSVLMANQLITHQQMCGKLIVTDVGLPAASSAQRLRR